MKTYWKLLRADGGSVTETYGRVIYPMGEEIIVSGVGVFLAATAPAVFSAGIPGEIISEFEASDVKKYYELAGVYVASKVRRVRDLNDDETKELCLAAVKLDGRMLQCVPKKMRTKEICLAAVKEYGGALESVPEQLRTEEMCLAAAKQNGWALEYVPEQLRTEEMYLAAAKQIWG